MVNVWLTAMKNLIKPLDRLSLHYFRSEGFFSII